MCQRAGACVKHVSSMCQGSEACAFVSKSLILLILQDGGPSCGFAPRRGRTGRPGTLPARRDPVFFDRTLCFSTGPCVFRPEPCVFRAEPCVFRAEPVSLALCFSGGSMCLWREAGVIGREHVSTGMCQRAGACVNGRGRCPRAGVMAREHVSTGRSMCLWAAGARFHRLYGMQGHCRFALRRGRAGRPGTLPARRDPVFFDRTLCFSGGALCLQPCVFRAEAGVPGGEQVSTGRCQRAGVNGQEHVSSAGVMTREQVSTACVKRAGHLSSAGVMAREHVPTGMCQRAGQVPSGRGHGAGTCVLGRCRRVGAGPAQRAAARAGAAKRRPSSRSSRPPWPGISRPLSFLPEARFQ